MMRMPAHAQADGFNQRRSKPGARALGSPREGGGDLLGIGAVDGDPGHAVTGGLVGEDPRGNGTRVGQPRGHTGGQLL